MDILGIGPLEFLFILIIALIVLGPNDMVKAGRTIGRTLRTIISSETWRVVQDASREIRNLPNRMMREAALDDLQKQFPSQSAIKSELGLDDLEKSLNDTLSSAQSSVKSASQGSPQKSNAGSDPGDNQSSDLAAWTTPPPTIGKPEHMQSPDSDTEGPSDDISSWTEPAKSIASTVQPPAEAEPTAGQPEPVADLSTAEAESPTQVDKTPAEKPEPSSTRSDSKEDQHDAQKTGSE